MNQAFSQQTTLQKEQDRLADRLQDKIVEVEEAEPSSADQTRRSSLQLVFDRSVFLLFRIDGDVCVTRIGRSGSVLSTYRSYSAT